MAAPAGRKPWLRIIMWALVAAAVIVAIIWLWKPLIALVSEQARLRQWVQGFGWAGPLVLIALQAVQVLIAPIPGQVVGLVSGFLFGTFWGMVYSMIGIVIGAAAVMWLARKLGRPFVERFVSPEHLERFDGLVERGGAAVFFLLFLLPFVPDDSISILAGLTSIPLSLLIVLALVGRFPGVLASSFIGAQAGSLTIGQWALLVGISLALGVPVLIYQDRLQTFTQALAEKLGEALHRPKNVP